MTPPLVTLDRVSVSSGRTSILVDVSVTVAPGTSLGVAGPNGSGKSTLLAVMATFLAPTGGTGSVLGVPLGSRDVAGIRNQIGWVGHDPGLYPELTLFENLRLEASIAGLGADRASEALEMVGLAQAADRRAADSSNGMQRRVDLARCLLRPPRLLLLDEADAGLDDSARTIVDALVSRTTRSGGGAVMVSHDRSSLAERVDRCSTLVAGRLA